MHAELWGWSLSHLLQGRTGRQTTVHRLIFPILKTCNKENGSPFWSPAQQPLARSHLCFIAIRQHTSPGCEKLFCVFVLSLCCRRNRKSQPSEQLAQACSKGARQATREHVVLHQTRETWSANTSDAALSFRSELIMKCTAKLEF